MGIDRAMYDPLTGLANRRLFEDRTGHALARAERKRWSTAVFAIDIDRFAEVNEAFGHSVGDEVLAEVARRLERCLRPYDNVARSLATVARLGGDEFLVTCEDVEDDEAARCVARRISDAFLDPLAVGRVSVSIGIVVVPAAGRDVGAAILDAEAALRRAKALGAGRAEVFTDGMRSSGGRRIEPGDELRHGLEAGQFVLHYQPKVDLADLRISGVEALVRWDRPGTGLVAPDRFIALAEQTGLIVELGAWVLGEACRQTHAWHARFADRPPLEVAVNVSAGQFRPKLVTTVADILDRTGMAAANVFLEVTESFVMADVDSAIVILGDLKRLGVSISIDDFGTGYSSLAYLRRLPIDELKIDRSFVDGLGREPEDTAIVASVVAMAHAMELSVVAEGVETEDQLQRLRVLGCDQAQGYYFARPLPPRVLEVLMADESTRLSKGYARGSDVGDRSGREVVVLADDSPDVLQLAAVSLSTAGYEVHQAENGRAAVDLARVVRPSCVVLDVRMPEMDGFEACRALRAEPSTAGCTIIMLTATADSVDKVEGFSAGADDYIVKPFTPRDLVTRIRAAMARRRAQPGSSQRPMG